jgi:hypothetical protein
MKLDILMHYEVNESTGEVKYIGKEDTYNMEVEEYHNFIANGIVVHNSIDAQRYLLAEWVDQGKCPQV